MKLPITIAASALFLSSTFFPYSLSAQSQADKYLGERETCLETMRIKETRVLDDQTILLETYGGAVYISRLPAPCVGLKISGGFSYETAIDKLCKQDIIGVVEVGSGLRTKCGMGEFIRIRDVSRLRDAMRLLKDGVLEALVEEGVFETSFHPEKSE
jgi:hypothetical protein